MKLKDIKTTEEFYRELLKKFLEKDYDAEEVYNTKPRKFKNPKMLAEKALDYFLYAKFNDEHISMTGLELHTGIMHRQEWVNYHKTVRVYPEDFRELIDLLKKIVEGQYIKDLYESKQSGNAARILLNTHFREDYTTQEKHINENTEIVVTIGKTAVDSD